MQEFYLKNLRSQVFLEIFFEFPDVLFKTGAQPCMFPTMSIYCFSLTSASFSSTQQTVMALKCHFCKYLPTSCRSLLLRCACFIKRGYIDKLLHTHLIFVLSYQTLQTKLFTSYKWFHVTQFSHKLKFFHSESLLLTKKNNRKNGPVLKIPITYNLYLDAVTDVSRWHAEVNHLSFLLEHIDPWRFVWDSTIRRFW